MEAMELEAVRELQGGDPEVIEMFKVVEVCWRRGKRGKGLLTLWWMGVLWYLDSVTGEPPRLVI